jgi:hypothetical protein
MSGFFWIEVLMYSMFLTILKNRVRVQNLRPAMLEFEIPVETTPREDRSISLCEVI